mgnify:CR=1 FL=1
MPRAPSRPAPQLDPAAQPLTALDGVGDKVAEKLAARGLMTLQDLWFHLPRQYEDRTELTPIRMLQPGRPVQVEGRVEAVERGFRYRPMLRVAIGAKLLHPLLDARGCRWRRGEKERGQQCGDPFEQSDRRHRHISFGNSDCWMLHNRHAK